MSSTEATSTPGELAILTALATLLSPACTNCGLCAEESSEDGGVLHVGRRMARIRTENWMGEVNNLTGLVFGYEKTLKSSLVIKKPDGSRRRTCASFIKLYPSICPHALYQDRVGGHEHVRTLQPADLHKGRCHKEP